MRGGPPAVSESEVKSGRAPCPTERATAAVAHDIEGQAPPSGGYAALDLPAAESSTAMPDTGVANVCALLSRCTRVVSPTRRRLRGSQRRGRAGGEAAVRCGAPVACERVMHK